MTCRSTEKNALIGKRAATSNLRGFFLPPRLVTQFLPRTGQLNVLLVAVRRRIQLAVYGYNQQSPLDFRQSLSFLHPVLLKSRPVVDGFFRTSVLHFLEGAFLLRFARHRPSVEKRRIALSSWHKVRKSDITDSGRYIPRSTIGFSLPGARAQ